MSVSESDTQSGWPAPEAGEETTGDGPVVAPTPTPTMLTDAQVRAIDYAVDGLSDSHPVLSARSRFSVRQRFLAVVVAAGFLVAFWFVPLLTGRILMAVMIAVYTAVIGLRVDLMVRSSDHDRFSFTREELDLLDPETLPTFTILVPAYREPEVLPHLVDNLAALEYPRDRMQIRLLLEEDDEETLAAAAAMDLQPPFEVIVVPPVGPRTKPKALNYALLDSSGDIVTIYDAEDRPDPLQLKKVAATFQQLGPEVACVQGELAYFNADENLITRWFAVEYRAWFTQFLPQLSKVQAPIPLGGTSNHFRRELLVQLGAWDPYNVTEDADLGIRLHRQGYRVAVLDSTTYEEANTDFVNWIKQRSRWYKGYAQTYLVHMRHPIRLLRDVGFAGFVRFNLFVGGTPLLAAINPISWMLLVLWFTLQPQFIVDIMIAPVYYAGLAGWLLGNFLFFYLNLAVAYRFGKWSIFRAALLLPGYWVMMAIAAVKAFYQLAFQPSYWEKTQHGLSAHAAPPVAADQREADAQTNDR